jgi:hypothetical protein
MACMARAVVVTLAILALVLLALWPAVSPPPPSMPSDACAGAQLRYEDRPTRDALEELLRRCKEGAARAVRPAA